MNVELELEFNQIAKCVSFFPYEWSSNLLAVCFTDSVRFFAFHDDIATTTTTPATTTTGGDQQQQETNNKHQLELLKVVPFENKIEQFTWSPRTNISSLKQQISFAISDCTQSLIFCQFDLIANQPQRQQHQQQTNIQDDPTLIFKREEIDVDCLFNISYDTHSGELLAFTADNFCFLWDCVDQQLRARFLLQSPGINICWNRNEQTKLMVGEKSGLLRIYSVETLKPIYTLACNLNVDFFPLISFDWSETNPEVIIANTNTRIFVWNTSKSCLPDEAASSLLLTSGDNNGSSSSNYFKKLKSVRISQIKENLIGFIDGRDASSRLTLMNIKSNQIMYQTENMKLLSSFSFNAVIPYIAMVNEQNLTLIKMIH